MCLLAVCESRKFSSADFADAWRANPDGVGFSWYENGQVVYHKGYMTLKQAREAYYKVNVFPHTVHFRLASSGGVARVLCHPYTITKQPSHSLHYRGYAPVLSHNGVISDWQSRVVELAMLGVKMESPYNDTKVVATQLGIIRQVGNNLEEFLEGTNGGRFTITYPDVIMMVGDFVKDNGIHLSNTYFRYNNRYHVKTPAKDDGTYYDDNLDDDIDFNDKRLWTRLPDGTYRYNKPLLQPTRYKDDRQLAAPSTAAANDAKHGTEYDPTDNRTFLNKGL